MAQIGLCLNRSGVVIKGVLGGIKKRFARKTTSEVKGLANVDSIVLSKQ